MVQNKVALKNHYFGDKLSWITSCQLICCITTKGLHHFISSGPTRLLNSCKKDRFSCITFHQLLWLSLSHIGPRAGPIIKWTFQLTLWNQRTGLRWVTVPRWIGLFMARYVMARYWLNGLAYEIPRAQLKVYLVVYIMMGLHKDKEKL
jgi:hypothetical protein